MDPNLASEFSGIAGTFSLSIMPTPITSRSGRGLPRCARTRPRHPGFFAHVPYINGRACTNFSELWKRNESEIEKYSSGGREHYGVADFFVMCPDTEYWQDLMATLAKRIFQEVKPDGLYIDQLGRAARPLP